MEARSRPASTSTSSRTPVGSHSIKAGVQYEKIKNEVATGENGNLFEIRWGLPDRFGAGVQGTYGSVHVRRFGTVRRGRVARTSASSSRTPGTSTRPSR